MRSNFKKKLERLLHLLIQFKVSSIASISTLADSTWLSTNFGIIVCIECSGVHREMGVHVSRIQSLTLDHVPTSQLLIAHHMSNQNFNEIMEATLHAAKPNASSTM